MARLVDQDSTRAAWGGTPGFAAPEQILDPESNDRRSDVFAVGMVLYAMLGRGVTAYGPTLSAKAITSPTALVHAYQGILDGTAPPVPLRSLAPMVSAELEAVVMRALSPRPAARFQTANEMAAALRRSHAVLGANGDSAPMHSAPRPIESHGGGAAVSSHRSAPATSSRAAFVGRERELGRLKSLLGEALDHRGQLCFITGEAGTGKSMLASELVRLAELEHGGLLAPSGECCFRTGPIDPYLPFREVLSSLVGGGGEVTATRELAGSILMETAPELIGKLVSRSHIAPVVLARRPLPSETPDLSRDQTFERIAEFFRALARRVPLVVTLDNVQCIDAVSVDLLGYLTRALHDAPIFFVALYRPSELLACGRHRLEPLLTETKQQRGNVWIDLDAIGTTELRAFVDALLDRQPNTFLESFRARLFEHTHGHALFTVELLRAMNEQGLIAADVEGRLGERQGAQWPCLPTRLEGVVEERLHRLDDDLRETLTIAGVGGMRFLAQSLALVRDRPARDVLRQLTQELDRKHRLVEEVGARRTARGLISEFRFRNVLAQQYLYDKLGESERMMLHGDLGAALENLFGDGAGDSAVVLARHFELAGETEKAIVYLRAAAERAASVSAYAEARGSLERALTLLAEHSELRARMEAEVRAALAAVSQQALEQASSSAASSP